MTLDASRCPENDAERERERKRREREKMRII
jgi:hypothetical protein